MVNYSDYPEADVVTDYVETRFKKGLNTNVFVIGLSGSGKSSTSIRLGELIKERRPEENLKFTIVDSLLSLLDAIKISKEGDVIIIEETSVLFPSRRAMAGDNVAVGKVFDTIRKRRLCIISNAPIWGSIDSHMRAMAHLRIETLAVVKDQKVVKSKFHRVQTNPASGKVYLHTMRRNGSLVQRMYTRMPDLETWKQYEGGKDKQMLDIYDKIKHEETKKKDKLDKEMGKKPKPSIKKLTEQELRVHTLHNVQKMNQREIGEELGVSQVRIHEILKNIMKKANLTKKMGDIAL